MNTIGARSVLQHFNSKFLDIIVKVGEKCLRNGKFIWATSTGIHGISYWIEHFMERLRFLNRWFHIQQFSKFLGDLFHQEGYFVEFYITFGLVFLDEVLSWLFFCYMLGWWGGMYESFSSKISAYLLNSTFWMTLYLKKLYM